MISSKILVLAGAVLILAGGYVAYQGKKVDTIVTSQVSTTKTLAPTVAATAEATAATAATVKPAPIPATGNVDDTIKSLEREGDDAAVTAEESDSSLVGADSTSVNEFDQASNVSNNDL